MPYNSSRNLCNTTYVTNSKLHLKQWIFPIFCLLSYSLLFSFSFTTFRHSCHAIKIFSVYSLPHFTCLLMHQFTQLCVQLIVGVYLFTNTNTRTHNLHECVEISIFISFQAKQMKRATFHSIQFPYAAAFSFALRIVMT